MDKETAKKLTLKAIDDYNKTAPVWSMKRWKLPSDILELKKYLKKGEKILDLGCGCGYLSEICEEVNYLGADVSVEQIKICQERYSNSKFVTIEPFNLPFDKETFDKVFSLSTIHHIAGTELQMRFLKDIKEVLKLGGQLFVTAWNLSENNIPSESKKINEQGDILVPFKDNEGKVLTERFIHCFSQLELENLVKEVGFKVLENRIVSRGTGKFSNILIIASKE